MKSFVLAALFCLVLGCSAFGQGKPWNEWSKKDAEKVLNDSAWGQSYKKGEAPPDMSSRSGSSANQRMGTAGPAALPTEVNMRIRLITAKPVREGFAARLLKSHPNPTPELTGQLQTIIDNGFGDFIVVAVNADGQNPQTVNATLRALSMLKTADLADKAYLERKDGKRLPIMEYKTPVNDDMGGKFVFARTLDGQPFLSEASDSVKFVLNLSDNLKLNAKFEVKKMMYDGKLEY